MSAEGGLCQLGSPPPLDRSIYAYRLASPFATAPNIVEHLSSLGAQPADCRLPDGAEVRLVIGAKPQRLSRQFPTYSQSARMCVAPGGKRRVRSLSTMPGRLFEAGDAETGE